MVLMTPAAVAAAHLEALNGLLEILRTATCPREIRLAAAAILRFKLPKDAQLPGIRTSAPAQASNPTAAPKTDPLGVPAATASPEQPKPEPRLTAAEIAELEVLLPTVPYVRYRSTESPQYWRDLLAQHRPPRSGGVMHAGAGPPPAAVAA